MFDVYILRSEKDRHYYIGCTNNLIVRLSWHNDGKNKSTVHRRPLKLIYSEKFADKTGALRRERQIESYKGGNKFKKLIRREIYNHGGGIA